MAKKDDMGRKIDYDRGVLFQQDSRSGMNVYMYTDTPGEYLNVHGKPVPDSIARAAGFDIDLYAKAKLRRERMAAAREAIDKEIELNATVEHKVIAEAQGYKAVDIGLERYNVVDPDSNTLNTIPLSKPVAMALLKELSGEDVEEVAEDE